MGSPFVDMKDLVAQGFDLSPEEAKYGGAYVVTEIIKGQPNVRLIFDDQQLEGYAQSKIPTTPNKWKREKKKQESTDVKVKYKDAYEALTQKGYSDEEAIDLIKKNEGIK